MYSVTWHDWEREHGTKADESSYDTIMHFLHESSQTLKTVELGSKNVGQRNGHPTGAARVFTTASTEIRCQVCKGTHYIGHCKKFQSISASEQRRVVDDKWLRSNCLTSHYITRKCRSSSACRRCDRRHHTLIHGASFIKRKTTSNGLGPPSNEKRSQRYKDNKVADDRST